tara:strand:- start:122 stop:562 length:441 start_codon:yes stop_codon:yes gene_type:complete
MKNIFFILIIIIGFSACKKEAGEGGTSIIEGKIIYFKKVINESTFQTDTIFFPKAGKDVYVIYSNNEGELYDDKFETDYNGRYRFEYLRKGVYTIFTYVDSVILNPNNGDVLETIDFPIYRYTEITSNNSTVRVGDFMIDKTDLNE